MKKSIVSRFRSMVVVLIGLSATPGLAFEICGMVPPIKEDSQPVCTPAENFEDIHRVCQSFYPAQDCINQACGEMYGSAEEVVEHCRFKYTPVQDLQSNVTAEFQQWASE